MSKRQSTLYLQDILEAVAKIEGYTDTVSFEKFVRSPEKTDAVIRNLEVIGE